MNEQELKKRQSELDRQIALLTIEKKYVQNQLGLLKKAPKVSDHAVIRYLERVHGFDFEQVRKEILDVAERGINLGAGKVKKDGYEFVIRDKTVITCIK